MTDEKKPLKEIKKEGKLFVLMALLDVGSYAELGETYSFTLDPENLYYDIHAKVDIGQKEELERGKSMDFLSEYKSLIGFCLQKKYGFEDYRQGGISLLSKNRFLKQIKEAETLEAVIELLQREYEEVYYEKHFRICEVKKGVYAGLRIYTVLLTILFIFLAAYSIYNHEWKTKKDQAFINAYELYLDKDYVAVIDKVSEIDNQYMSGKMKLILSTAYVRTENLTPEQKENILDDINTVATDKIMDYWIYLGREKTAEAENIAKQLSDDEMLLYAYMKELSILKENTDMDGEEKASRITLLEGEIEKLKKAYEIEEEE
ncbi:MAG: type VII secretion protein EssB/YukC [Lachnospiraceae bacterium]